MKLIELGWGTTSRRSASFRYSVHADANLEHIRRYRMMRRVLACSCRAHSSCTRRDRRRSAGAASEMSDDGDSRRGDLRVPFEEGRWIAAQISGHALLPSRAAITSCSRPSWPGRPASPLWTTSSPTGSHFAATLFRTYGSGNATSWSGLAQGLDNAQIAAHLNLAEKTCATTSPTSSTRSCRERSRHRPARDPASGRMSQQIRFCKSFDGTASLRRPSDISFAARTAQERSLSPSPSLCGLASLRRSACRRRGTGVRVDVRGCTSVDVPVIWWCFGCYPATKPNSSVRCSPPSSVDLRGSPRRRNRTLNSDLNGPQPVDRNPLHLSAIDCGIDTSSRLGHACNHGSITASVAPALRKPR